MAFKSLSEIKRVVEQAKVTKAPKRDDGLTIYQVDLVEFDNRTIGIEAASEEEAREKVIKHLSEIDLPKQEEGK